MPVPRHRVEIFGFLSHGQSDKMAHRSPTSRLVNNPG